MARWAEYFEQLFMVDPPSGQLWTAGLQTLNADPPIHETALSIDDVKEAVAGVCNISAKVVKAGDEPMIRRLHVVFIFIWHSRTISPDCKKRKSFLSERGKGTVRTAITMVE